MARRFSKKDGETGESSDPGSGPSSGIIKLQPSRRAGSSAWSSSQSISDNSKYLGANNPESALPGLAQTPFNTGESVLGSARSTESMFNQMQASMGGLSLSETRPLLPANKLEHSREFQKSIESLSREEKDPLTRTTAVDSIFGSLPDPVRLQEKLGDFDGQVIFIGHPNRDVSAHQWSLFSFQWEIIGRWNSKTKKIEGSIASDHPRGSDTVQHTIQYFKSAAEYRERLVETFGRPEEREEAIASQRPSLSDADRMASLSTVSGSSHGGPSTRGLPTDTSAVPRRYYPQLRLSEKDSNTVTRKELEDPFVTSGTTSQLTDPTTLKPKATGSNAKGSMDFDYAFPGTKGGPPIDELLNGDVETRMRFIQRERERLAALRREAQARERKTPTPFTLPEVGFGEEASSAFPGPTRSDTLPRPFVASSPDDLRNRQKLKEKLEDIGNQAHGRTESTNQRVAIPSVPALQPSLRTLRPPPGLTVANPHRTSTLNANAPPYTRTFALSQPSGDVQSETTTVNTTQPVNLQFSDPDGFRSAQVHEIANGFGHQAPTKQNFKGPFFTNSKPTANDPTASLTVPISEEEKLVNWFRDGHRPARQEEYSKSLVSAAIASNRVRSFGAIGEGSPQVQDQDGYINTSAFLRLYENLSEYVEESKSGNRSYWTKAWKKPLPSLCDLNPGGNDSFFETRPHTTGWPSPEHLRVPGQPITSQPIGGIGGNDNKSDQVQGVPSQAARPRAPGLPGSQGGSIQATRAPTDGFSGMRLGGF